MLSYVGINTSDHELMFAQLIDQVGELGHLFARLFAKDCSNLKSAIKGVIEQFMGLDRDLEDENGEMVDFSIQLMFLIFKEFGRDASFQK